MNGGRSKLSDWSGFGRANILVKPHYYLDLVSLNFTVAKPIQQIVLYYSRSSWIHFSLVNRTKQLSKEILWPENFSPEKLSAIMVRVVVIYTS